MTAEHSTEPEVNTDAPEPAINAVLGEELCQGLSISDLCCAQENDSTIGEVLCAKKAGKKPPQTGLQGKSLEFKRLLQLWDELKVLDGILWQTYEAEDGYSHTLQLIVPQKYREGIVQELHNGIMGGHLGPEKTHNKLKQRFYWPGYWNDVKTLYQLQKLRHAEVRNSQEESSFAACLHRISIRDGGSGYYWSLPGE